MKSTLRVVFGLALAAAIAAPWAMLRRTSRELVERDAALRRERDKSASLEKENDVLKARITNLARAPVENREQTLELMRLRGEVGRLRQQAASAPASNAPAKPRPSVLSGITDNPEMKKMIRGQQKMGMGLLYRGFAKDANLTPEQTEKLNELLADSVMENINVITAALREGKSPAEAEPDFAGQDAATLKKVEEALGPEALEKYKEYTRNLASSLTAEQFSSQLGLEDAAKTALKEKLARAMREETGQTLASSGLPPDFQTLPILNFRNIAFEDQAELNLQLLDGIYERVGVRARSFLEPEQLEKFAAFRKEAIQNSRTILGVNRKMMAPQIER